MKAGKYELLAVRWDQVLSKPGEPFNFTRYRKGDVVDLDVEDARRLVKAGAVTPVSETDGDDGSDADTAPAKSASKADWEAYARAEGATDADLDGVTKDDLVAAYGGEA